MTFYGSQPASFVGNPIEEQQLARATRNNSEATELHHTAHGLIREGLKRLQAGEDRLALAFFERAVDIGRGLKIDELSAYGLSHASLAAERLGFNKRALALAEEMLALARSPQLLSSAHNRLAVLHLSRNNSNQALLHSHEVLKILKQDRRLEQMLLGVTLFNIGEAYQRQDNYKEALTYYTRALEDFVRNGMDERAARTRTAIGKIHALERRTPQARLFLDLALAFFEEQKALAEVARILEILGALRIVEGDNRNGRQDLARAAALYGQVGNHADQTRVLGDIAAVERTLRAR